MLPDSIQVFDQYEEMSLAAAAFINRCVLSKHNLLLCPASGNSPRRSYDALVARMNETRMHDAMRVISLDEWVGIPRSSQHSGGYQLMSQLIGPLGIRDYFRKLGFSKAILGASGGIDSAVTQVLAVDALGSDQVLAVGMPSRFSSDHSVSDAGELSRHLGNRFELIPIENIYTAFLTALKPQFADTPFGIAEENIQSRSRGNLLMAIANKFGYILLNTSNKSELATGYGTLYGDMAGGLSVLGDVYKMQVYALARYLNRKTERVPGNIITKAPSAELRPNQKDSDSLPEYEILDRILYQYIERRQGPQEIIAMGYEPALVSRILRMVNNNEYKRNQFCPIIRVSAKAFGIGRRVPIVAKYLG